MIELQHKEMVGDAKFSILIPTWNSLAFLQKCIMSIRKNSTYNHQIIIHINEGSDGSLEWIQNSGLSYTYSKNNIGICWAMNAMRRLVATDYIVYINDDMYVCPGWDEALLKEIESLPDNRFYLSSTLLQPRKFWCKSIISPVNFGEDIESFEEETLLKHYMNLPHGDWNGSTWPPTIVHRDIWDLVGGYSVEFSPGMYSDPDLSAKLYLSGIRYFKGVDKSRVYHFEARSTGRVKKNKGARQFLSKWGITSSSFMKFMLHRGEPFKEYPKPVFRIKFALIRSKIKWIIGLFLPIGATKKLWKI
jgi:glycosyltransferase involved in cell wall biosynthesis